MKTKKEFSMIIYFFLAIYIGLTIMIFAVIFSIPNWLRQAEAKYVDQAQIEIVQLFETTDKKDLAESFIALKNGGYPIEIVIEELDGTPIYQSISGLTLKNARNVIPEKIALLENRGEIKGKDGIYNTWFTIYRPNAEFYVTNLFILQTIFIGILFMVLIAITYFLYRLLLKPLNIVKQTLTKLENYEFETIDFVPEDEITAGIKRFTTSLKDNIDIVSRKHTKLEYALQLERERLQNMITVSRGIIHDLKSPLYQTMLENESLLQKKKLEKETTEVINYNVERIDLIMRQITDVLKLMNTNVKDMIEVKDEFNVATMVKEIRLSFIPLLEKHELWLTTDIEENSFVKMNKVTLYLIVHNILSNAIQYASQESEVILTVYMDEHDNLHIQCSNETTPENINRIKNSDTLFQTERVSDTDDVYTYSTGNGIYLIRELVNISNGMFTIDFLEGEVLIHVSLPIV